MIYGHLGRTGLRVSAIGIGAGGPSRLGLANGGSRDSAIRLIRFGVGSRRERYRFSRHLWHGNPCRSGHPRLATEFDPLSQSHIRPIFLGFGWLAKRLQAIRQAWRKDRVCPLWSGDGKTGSCEPPSPQHRLYRYLPFARRDAGAICVRTRARFTRTCSTEGKRQGSLDWNNRSLFPRHHASGARAGCR